MKCHYEVLGVPREATSAEIKTAYRKLALQWHPDKNLDNEVYAKEQFQLVQNAYEVLSDSQERAWYDNHREQLLRGAGSSYNDDSLDVFPYFSPSCYKGYGEDSKGFYAVYNEVFSKLIAEETDFLEDPEDVANIPEFGNSKTSYDKVNNFYGFWMSFSTSKSFVWLDQYNVQQGDNRRIIKLMEKENNKIRQKARKERNEEIRGLVRFVRRRDPRVQEHARLLQEKAELNKKKAEQLRKEHIIQRQREIQEEQMKQGNSSLIHSDEYQRQLNEIDSLVKEEFGLSSDDDTVSEDGMESSNEESSKTEPSDIVKTSKTQEKQTRVRNLFCSACNKPFKNVKSFENHENSKKHKENVAKMTVDLDMTDESYEEEDDDEQEKKVEMKDEGLSERFNNIKIESRTISDESDEVPVVEKNKKSKSKKRRQFLAVESDGNDSHDEMSFNEIEAPARSRRAKKMTNMKNLLEIRKKEDEANLRAQEEATKCLEENIVVNDRSNNTTEKNKKCKKEKVKESPTDNVDRTLLTCAICKSDFPSKNKLFEHLKKTGHSVALAQNVPQQQKKGKRNR